MLDRPGAASNAHKLLLEARGITRRFGGLLAVSDLTFELREGEILGLIGPNGAGKSTTFNLLSGFYRLTSGSISFLGERLESGHPWKAARRGLIRTFQHDSLLKDMTVYDNILIGACQSIRRPSERDTRVRETARIMHLDGLLDETARNLPHGLQRMLSMAIAFAGRPKLLCLDEPLTGLNQTEAAEALKVIRRLRDEFGISILFVEHNMRAVMSLCDRIVVLHHGRKLASGTPAEISNDPVVIDAYLGGAIDAAD
ncbi:ABC transporter ATP-binding protein [Rhodoligotrophos ferricapiens]|uniref:ABC transporter ATP-binding protein n=1 Tax=Rhodoligotrophos ferricapiens TaxID=3069264 RepID=UPI00315D247D